jgi:hypothetical protein
MDDRWFKSRQELGIFLSPPRPDRLWGQLSLISNGYVKLTTYLHLVTRSRMRGAISPLPNTPPRCGAQLKVAQGQLYLTSCPVRATCPSAILTDFITLIVSGKECKLWIEIAREKLWSYFIVLSHSCRVFVQEAVEIDPNSNSESEACAYR